MSVGTPAPRIGAEFPLGYNQQSALGTPVAPTAAVGQWINQTANTLEYQTGEHMLDTALGTRASEQESAQGEIHLGGGFEANLRTSTARGLIDAFFGGATTVTSGVETQTMSRPKLLTLHDNWASEEHQYQDCVLDTLTLSCGNHLEWKLAFAVLGGLQTLVDTVSPTFSSNDRTLAWADVSGLSGFDVGAGQVSQWTSTFSNGAKADYGMGQHSYTSVIGGKYSIRGTAMIRYDDANAADYFLKYANGLDLTANTVLTIGAAGSGATATATVGGGAVTSIAVTAPGSGYLSGAEVYVTGDGTGAIAHAVMASDGTVASITVDTGGTAYTAATVVIVPNKHVITLPKITILTATKQSPLDDYIRLSATFGVKHAEAATWALPAGY